MDPMTGRIGLAETKERQQVRLQLEPEATLFVRTFNRNIAGEKWRYDSIDGERIPLQGAWQIEFLAGGPELPAAITTQQLASWTTFEPSETERFAGTAAYAIQFDGPADGAEHYVLDLGDVRDSARVLLNGEEAGSLITPPFRMAIGPLRPGKNDLRVEVTNVAANRIRDLDRRGVRWRVFQDINLVNINYRPFDASDWPVREAGLLGPVTLQSSKAK
jgi:hypothetical protein